MQCYQRTIDAKKASDKAAIEESKEKARLATKKAKLSEKNACVVTLLLFYFFSSIKSIVHQ